MKTRAGPSDRIILYLVAAVVLVGFIGFAAYDELGGHTGKSKPGHLLAGAPNSTVPMKSSAGSSVAPQPTTITTLPVVPMPRIVGVPLTRMMPVRAPILRRQFSAGPPPLRLCPGAKPPRLQTTR
jgi:hypothetical protein